MTSNLTRLHPSSVMFCDIFHAYIPTGMKAIALQTAVAIVNIIIALFGTLANSLVIMAYYRNPRLRTIQNTIFFVLTITDISVTAFIEPTYVAVILSGLLGKPSCLLCDMNAVLSSLFLNLSLATIVILSLQSYITLAYPYHWQSIITKFRFNMAMVFSWLLSSTMTFSSFAQKYLIFIIMYVPPCMVFLEIIIVVFTWCWTYKLVARHRKAIETTQTPSSSQNISRKKILRSTITAFVVILSLFACYFLSLCFFFFQTYINPSKLGVDTYMSLWSVALTLMYLNSLLNPCLVFWRNTPFRETVKSVFN